MLNSDSFIENIYNLFKTGLKVIVNAAEGPKECDQT